MPEPDLETLRHNLLVAGWPRRSADRLVRELEDHYQDLLEEAAAAGLAGDQAAADALARLGSDAVLMQTALDQSPVVCLGINDVVLQSAQQCGRWCIAVCGSALFTAGFLFLLQVAILR